MTINPSANLNPLKIDDLFSNKDTLGLLRLLRTDPDPEVRSQVAVRLPELDADEIVEGLIRSYILDPDLKVKHSARAALDKILGSTASDAIEAYGEIRPEDDEFEKALLATQGIDPDEVVENHEDYAPQVQAALEYQQVQKLQTLLVSSRSADLRAQAAEALGEITEDSSIEILVRAMKADPDEFVRGVASATLSKLLGPDTAAAALAAYKDFDFQEYQSNLQTPPSWLAETDMDAWDAAQENNSQEIPTALSAEQINALGSVVSDDRQPDRQIKALNILAKQPTLEGNNAITAAALWSENPIVRQHAHNILESVYGEELQSYLAEFEKTGGIDALSDEIDNSDDDEYDVQDDPEVFTYTQITNIDDIPYTHEEEKSHIGLQLILIILLIVILIILVQRFVLH